MIFQSLVGLGKSKCDVSTNTTHEWACPKIHLHIFNKFVLGGGCNFQTFKCDLRACKHWWISFSIIKTHSHSSNMFVFGKVSHFQTFKCFWDLMDINEYELGKKIVKGPTKVINGHSLKLHFCMFERSQMTHNYLNFHNFFEIFS